MRFREGAFISRYKVLQPLKSTTSPHPFFLLGRIIQRASTPSHPSQGLLHHWAHVTQFRLIKAIQPSPAHFLWVDCRGVGDTVPLICGPQSNPLLQFLDTPHPLFQWAEDTDIVSMSFRKTWDTSCKGNPEDQLWRNSKDKMLCEGSS